jgi:RES domain-containing protein
VQYDRDLLQSLARIPASRWSGVVYRHMFANYPPNRDNTLGARWNPPEVPAIYTSLSRDTIIAEVEYQISLEPLRPRVRRTVYEIGVALSAMLDLSSPNLLNRLGLSSDDLVSIDHSSCQMIGGAVEHLGHDGLLVASARATGGLNLVIYPNRQTAEDKFEVLAQEIIFDPDQDST